MRADAEKPGIFDAIAPVYGLFYGCQKRKYSRLLDEHAQALGLNEIDSAIDIGCGTGALCAALYTKGIAITGVEPAERMLRVGKSRHENSGIRFLRADALMTLPFPDKSFDAAFASHVAHGLSPQGRQVLYAEMRRLARRAVILYDYHATRAPHVALIEKLEGGDYFRFIRQAEAELRAIFPQVRVIRAGKRSSWYICDPG
ncbi:MAG: class I SAM-dependent methyltransferase [Eubacteriales bacterium]|nr:class I SAM-dependent methyltransferase [Eubacteriales bacterium]